MEAWRCAIVVMFLMYIIHIYRTHCHPFPAMPQHAIETTGPQEFGEQNHAGSGCRRFLTSNSKDGATFGDQRLFFSKSTKNILQITGHKSCSDLIGKLL